VPILQQLRPGPNHGRASSAVPPMCPAGSTFLNVRGPARLFERRAGGAAQEHGRALRGPGARSSAALPRSTVKRCAAPAHGRAPRGLGARSSAARPRRTVERCAAPAHGRALRGPGARSSAARPRSTVERCAAPERDCCGVCDIRRAVQVGAGCLSTYPRLAVDPLLDLSVMFQRQSACTIQMRER
jgi:hypothetical protein